MTTNTSTESRTKGRGLPKAAKVGIATGLSVALLLGGGGTLAVWNAQVEARAGAIASGNLELDAISPGVWTSSISGPVDLDSFHVSPGETLTFKQELDVTLDGDNIKATLVPIGAGINKGFDPADVTVDTTPTLIGPDGGILSDTILTESQIVTASMSFQFHDDASSSGAKFDFSDVGYRLEQGVGQAGEPSNPDEEVEEPESPAPGAFQSPAIQAYFAEYKSVAEQVGPAIAAQSASNPDYMRGVWASILSSATKDGVDTEALWPGIHGPFGDVDRDLVSGEGLKLDIEFDGGGVYESIMYEMNRVMTHGGYNFLSIDYASGSVTVDDEYLENYAGSDSEAKKRELQYDMDGLSQMFSLFAERGLASGAEDSTGTVRFEAPLGDPADPDAILVIENTGKILFDGDNATVTVTRIKDGADLSKYDAFVESARTSLDYSLGYAHTPGFGAAVVEALGYGDEYDSNIIAPDLVQTILAEIQANVVDTYKG